jgi:hypothetical protein
MVGDGPHRTYGPGGEYRLRVPPPIVAVGTAALIFVVLAAGVTTFIFSLRCGPTSSTCCRACRDADETQGDERQIADSEVLLTPPGLLAHSHGMMFRST